MRYSSQSIAYSPNGQHIVSGSIDRMIQIWDAKTGTAVGEPLKGHSSTVRSVAYSPDGQHIVSGSTNATIHVWDSFPHSSVPLSSSFNPVHDDFVAQPDADGWVRDSMDGLLYWVPPDCHVGLYSSALLTIPPTSHTQSVSLDLEDFAFGTAWTQIFNTGTPTMSHSSAPSSKVTHGLQGHPLPLDLLSSCPPPCDPLWTYTRLVTCPT
jgi:WD40 repeat protein